MALLVSGALCLVPRACRERKLAADDLAIIIIQITELPQRQMIGQLLLFIYAHTYTALCERSLNWEACRAILE